MFNQSHKHCILIDIVNLTIRSTGTVHLDAGVLSTN